MIRYSNKLQDISRRVDLAKPEYSKKVLLKKKERERDNYKMKKLQNYKQITNQSK